MTLEGVADKITYPLLVVHGENDRQVLPLWRAERTIEAAVNSRQRELKICRLADGAAERQARRLVMIAAADCGVRTV